MKVTNVRSDEERAVLTALIVHDDILSTVHLKLGEETRPFENKWSNTILQWCRLYFEKYQKAPRKHITSLFRRHADKIQDEDAVALIESFLSRLSKDHEAVAQEMNEKYLLDLASSYFERVRLTRYTEALQQSLENRDLEDARAKVADYKSLDFSSTSWTDPFSKDTVQRTLHYLEKDRSLVRFRGDLDRFLSPAFERDGFIAFAAPEKRGKSFWLLEVVFQAIKQRRKVLYYIFGDMSQDQVNRRLYCRLTGQPSKPGVVRVPTSLSSNEDRPVVEYASERREPATVGRIVEATERLRQATASKELPLKMKCAGASTVSAGEIEQDVKQWAASGWVPDLVVIDYADLLAPEAHSRSQEYRHQVNETWKVLRRISLDCHCLVVTATQAAATSYDARVIRKKDFSEDKRKNAHVTGMLGINQTSEEKQQGLYRLNWIFLRDGEWADTQTVWTAGSLAIANPAILSSF